MMDMTAAHRTAGATNLGAFSIPQATSGTDYRDSKIAKHFASTSEFEKDTIIAPYLRKVFERHVMSLNKPGKKIVVDYGAGGGRLSVPFISDGHIYRGYDNSPEMITQANAHIKNIGIKVDKDFPDRFYFTQDYNRILHDVRAGSAQGADFGIVSFVHPCMGTEQDLDDLTQKVSNLMAPNATVVMIGCNPEGLNQQHVTCQYDVTDPEALKDGELYNGELFDANGNSKLLIRDRYYSNERLAQSWNKAGMMHITTDLIKDIRGNSTRPVSPSGIAPFQGMVFRKIPMSFGK